MTSFLQLIVKNTSALHRALQGIRVRNYFEIDEEKCTLITFIMLSDVFLTYLFDQLFCIGLTVIRVTLDPRSSVLGQQMFW